jgi:adenylate cyclase
MGADEVGTLNRLKAVRKALVDPTIASYRGRIVKTTGDGMLVEFASAVDAVRCAIEVLDGMAGQSAAGLPDTRIEFRIGIHVGDIIFDDNDIFGDGVNIAARLEGIAEPGGVCMSEDTYRQIRGKIEIVCDDLGPQNLKNIAEPVRVWRVQLGGRSATTAQLNSPPNQASALALPDKPSIAVLPFQNMSGDPEQEYFADGMVEDIITALSRFKSIFVIARNSSFTYKGRVTDIKQVGRELGVRYVLEGSVRKVGSRVRIVGQLIDAATGTHVWADRFDRDLVDIFSLQDEVAQKVVSAVEPNLRSAEIARKSAVPTENLAAYDLYLRAVAEAVSWSQDGFQNAELLLRKSIQLDAHYSDAWATLADVIGRQIVAGWKSQAKFSAEMLDAALMSVKLDPVNGEALGVAAWALPIVGGSLDQASDFAHRAIAVHPNSAIVRAHCGWALLYNAEFDAALESLETAKRMNPLDPRFHMINSGMAAAHFFQRHFDETVRLAEATLARTPKHPISLRYMTAALVHLGRLEEARIAAETASGTLGCSNFWKALFARQAFLSEVSSLRL